MIPGQVRPQILEELNVKEAAWLHGVMLEVAAS